MTKKYLFTLILLFSTKLVFSQFVIQQNFGNAGCNVVFWVYDINGIGLAVGSPTPPNPSATTCISGTPNYVDISYNGSPVMRFLVNDPPKNTKITCNGVIIYYWVDVKFVTGVSSVPGCSDVLILTF